MKTIRVYLTFVQSVLLFFRVFNRSASTIQAHLLTMSFLHKNKAKYCKQCTQPAKKVKQHIYQYQEDGKPNIKCSYVKCFLRYTVRTISIKALYTYPRNYFVIKKERQKYRCTCFPYKRTPLDLSFVVTVLFRQFLPLVIQESTRFRLRLDPRVIQQSTFYLTRQLTWSLLVLVLFHHSF